MKECCNKYFKLLNYSKVYKFNQNNDEISVVTTRENPKYYYSVKQEYDDKANLVKRFFYTQTEGQPSAEWEENYVYQKNDELGNWTEQVILDGNKKLKNAIQRKIIYRK